MAPRTLSAVAVVFGLGWASAGAQEGAPPTVNEPARATASPGDSSEGAAKPAPSLQPIQIAILLDTSSSMDGLIEQAKTHLWSVVSEFASTKRDGAVPPLEVALYEYGNAALSGENGYIRLVQPLTGDLDAVSAGLFSLTTNGGDEYCGQVIATAVSSLNWGADPDAYRAIFIAGNEPFTQGKVAYKQACRDAIAKGILVNTIYCGSAEDGIAGKWRDAAQIADGAYLTINQDESLAHVAAPQDAELARLNDELNATYLWYGDAAADARANQVLQDWNAGGLAPSVLSERVAAKASSVYRNAGADLVDAVGQKEVNLDQLCPLPRHR